MAWILIPLKDLLWIFKVHGRLYHQCLLNGTFDFYFFLLPIFLFRADFAAHVYDNKLFVFGGEILADKDVPQTCEYFDGEAWHPFGNLPPDVQPLAALTWKNILHPEMIPELYDVTLDDDDTISTRTEVHGA